MCANYRIPVQLHLGFNVPPPTQSAGDSAGSEIPVEIYPGYLAPMLLADDAATGGQLRSVSAMFGLVPGWAKDTTFSRHTYNARSETVAGKPSYRNAWKRRQFCLIPVQGFYEPNYESSSGKPVRWSIHRRDGQPFALAGIFETRTDRGSGERLHSFSMLTINADGHPLMRRFHAPDDEKRSVVVIGTEDYAGWLGAESETEARNYLKPFDADAFTAVPAPRIQHNEKSRRG